MVFAPNFRRVVSRNDLALIFCIPKHNPAGNMGAVPLSAEFGEPR